MASLEKGSAEARQPQSVPRSAGVAIVGSPRSSTTILAWTLAAHPRFATSAESDYLLDLFDRGHLHLGCRRAYERPDEGWLKTIGVG